MTRTRTDRRTEKRRSETVHAVTSLLAADATPAQIADGCAGIGESKIPCTGSAMSPSTKTAARSAPAADHKSWRPCATSLSACTASTAKPTSPKPADTTAETLTARSHYYWPAEMRQRQHPAPEDTQNMGNRRAVADGGDVLDLTGIFSDGRYPWPW